MEESDAIPAPPRERSDPFLLLKIGGLLLVGFLVAFFVAPTNSRAVGFYISPSDSGLIVMDVRADGTYTQYDQRQEISRGHWRLENSFLIFKSMVFEDSYRLPVSVDDLKAGKHEYWYPLYHRAGELCFRVGPDPEYWCKHKSPDEVEK